MADISLFKIYYISNELSLIYDVWVKQPELDAYSQYFQRFSVVTIYGFR